MTYNTEQRNLLLAFFKSSPDTMFSASQIAAALEQSKISRSAVYRNLAVLEQEGKIRRYTKEQSREAFFQFYDVQSCREHIHMSCTECGKIFHMENKIAQKTSKELQ